MRSGSASDRMRSRGDESRWSWQRASSVRAKGGGRQGRERARWGKRTDGRDGPAQKTSWAYSQSSVAWPYASQSSHHGPSSAPPADRPLSDDLCASGERPSVVEVWPRLPEKTASEEDDDWGEHGRTWLSEAPRSSSRTHGGSTRSRAQAHRRARRCLADGKQGRSAAGCDGRTQKGHSQRTLQARRLGGKAAERRRRVVALAPPVGRRRRLGARG
jgi:hypothetical protein